MPCGKTGLGQSPCDILMVWLGQLAISFSSDIAEFKRRSHWIAFSVFGRARRSIFWSAPQ